MAEVYTCIVKLPPKDCHWTSLMISQHWYCIGSMDALRGTDLFDSPTRGRISLTVADVL